MVIFIDKFSSPLFNRVNVSSGENEDRMMMTGLHTVADIFCVGCGSIVGWKYVSFCGTYSKSMVYVSLLVSMLLVTWVVSFRKQPMRRTRSTRKENLSLNGE